MVRLVPPDPGQPSVGHPLTEVILGLAYDKNVLARENKLPELTTTGNNCPVPDGNTHNSCVLEVKAEMAHVLDPTRMATLALLVAKLVPVTVKVTPPAVGQLMVDAPVESAGEEEADDAVQPDTAVTTGDTGYK